MLLQLDNLNVFYGESHILRNISFEMEPGQVVCLMGRNGVGKTTLLKTIMGLLRSKTGCIWFEGVDISQDSPDRRVRRGLAYAPQGREIFPHLTVQDNLRLGFEASGRMQNHGSEGTAFGEGFALFPTLTSVLNRPGGVLSGGEQEQLASAPGVESKGKLLLLDDPTERMHPSIR